MPDNCVRCETAFAGRNSSFCRTLSDVRSKYSGLLGGLNPLPQFNVSTYQRVVNHLTFTFSKSTIETLEKDVKYVQS